MTSFASLLALPALPLPPKPVLLGFLALGAQWLVLFAFWLASTVANARRARSRATGVRAIPRRKRRALVGLATLLFIADVWIAPDLASGYIFCMPVFIASMSCLRRYTFIHIPALNLDERQREQVLVSYKTAYGCLTLVPIAAALALLVRLQQTLIAGDLPALGWRATLSLALIAFMMTLLLPGLILAWREPDAPQDEQRAEPHQA